MSFDNNTPNNTTETVERKHHDRKQTDDPYISRTDMNMLIMNYLVTGKLILYHEDIYDLFL